MKTKIIIAAVFVLSLVVSSSGMAQEALGLDSLIRYAAKNSLLIKQQEVSTQDAKIDLSSAKSNFLPTVSASISQGFSFGRSEDRTGVQVNRSSASTSFGVSAGYSLFTGLTRIHQLRAAKIGLDMAILDEERKLNDLSLQVSALYYSALLCQEILAVEEVRVELTREQTEQTRMKVAAGKWSDIKNYEMEAQLANEEFAVTAAKNDLNMAMLQLAQAINWQGDHETLQIKTPSSDELIANAMSGLSSSRSIYESAITRMPQIKASELAVDRSRENEQMALSGYIPQIGFSAGYGNGYYHYFGEENKPLNQPFEKQWQNNGSFSLGFSLNIPIFDALKTRNQRRRAKANTTLSRLNLDAAHQELYKEITEASLNAKNAAEQISVSERAVAAAKRAFEAAELQFAEGRISTYEYNESKTKFTIADVNRLKAIYDFVYKSRVVDFYRGLIPAVQ